ncbi:MAG TPA: hypothetical protein VFW71_03180 [Actinomycetota bacterium]|nr:hypothetical protein [Actinomycetota bacterium]
MDQSLLDGSISRLDCVSVVEPEPELHRAIYPPAEALRRARRLPPPRDLVDQDLSEEEWARFQEALAQE